MKKKIGCIKHLFVLSALLWSVAGANAQTLITIDGKEKISADEFLQMYNKNSASAIDNSDIDSYLNLYVNYRLKLLQAHELGLDKYSSVIKQTEDYRNSLIRPYINDPAVTDSLVRQAYGRLNYFVRASHILIAVPDNIADKDTMQYYNKALEVYKKAQSGENFDSLVRVYSDDPSASSENGVANGGDLGYFTSMVMVYPFENAVYTLAENKTDSIGMCRSSFGWHIIKLTDCMEAPFSSVTLAHIYINAKKHSEQEAEELINEAYQQIETLGFDSVVSKYSDDNFSASSKGVITNQKPNMLPAEYIQMFSKVPLHTPTQPFKTRFGWHIVKFISTVPVPQFEDIMPQIKDRVNKDDRAYISSERFVENAKKEYGYTVNDKALEELSSVVGEEIFDATWMIPEDFKGNKTLMQIGGQTFSQRDFLEYIFENQTKITPIHISRYLNQRFEAFSYRKVLEYASSHLEEKYPQLKQSVEDFLNGVLIFDLTDRQVWTKSVTDSVGLEEFYQSNKNKYLYTERADAAIWSFDTLTDLKKAQKLLAKYMKKGKTNDQTKDLLNKKYPKTTYVWGKFEKGANNLIDKHIFANRQKFNGVKYPYYCDDTATVTNRNFVIALYGFLPVDVKPLSACKGLVTSDYQDFLEKKWTEDLHKEHSVEINQELLKEIKRNINK